MASVTFKRGTRAEIEATAKQDGQILMETDQNKKNKMYIDLPDGSRVLIGNSGEAIDTFYDNSTSGLDATNVQNAIDTLNSNLTEILSTPIRQRFDLEKNANQFFTGIIWCSNNDLQNYPLVNGLLFSVVSGDVGFQIAIGYQNSGMYYRDITNTIYNSWVRIN